MKTAFIAALALVALMATSAAHAQTGKVHSLGDLLCSYYGFCANSTIADTNVTVGTSAVNVSLNSPAAIELTLTNNSANQVWCSNSDLVASGTGVQVPSNSTLVLNWQSDFDSVGAPWFCIASAAGSTVHVHKVSLN